eukprot:CAMPEP_0172526178 /NCGR_PEP_ID=MMETSP1067-20121228/1141_1 /TAXON_ID=265564 ORGANISM="Thalassiosira punctigera, Strain Tpunct2005C2" /NCGR_SAMPLE_ID=MMETSP1067 /ASSEMBLY_ACC=CAM_ASM_000444 /LENGTH=553 /DNA_ID=CAMNT_0013309627 /DNA_START=19 /DNA_END=1680 /DNA_ORIENTATION=+
MTASVMTEDEHDGVHPAGRFPVGSSVLLQNLVKGAHLNDKKGIVKSRPNAVGRQEVFVFEAQKSMAIRPANLRYQPRELSSLSVFEMKGMLLASKNTELEPTEWSGMDKDDLQRIVAAEIDTTDPGEIAALVAKANEPKERKNSAASLHSSEQLRQGAERMSQMSPDDIRRQAATMKAMGPAALRACTPQMAGMTDAQINMAIAQMEAVANNPSQLKMAADQMKNMSDSDLRQAVDQSVLAPQGSAAAASSPSTNDSAGTTPSSVGPVPSMANVSKSHFQQATQQMSNMSPDQLREQARMLKSTPLETLRRTNPQMANMSDAQIRMSITQLEQMAENPDMVKMAADQMKNMTDEQYESMKRMVGGGGLNNGSEGGASSADGPAATSPGGLPTDPSKMMEALLSSPEQLNSMIKMVKKNPDMLKQMMASQMGPEGEEGNNDGKNAKRVQMEKAIDSFVEMDDKQLERYLKVANTVQSVAKPVLTTFDRVKRTLGVSTKTLVVLINLMILASLVLLARWWRLRGGSIKSENDISAHVREELPPEIIDASYEESEF